MSSPRRRTKVPLVASTITSTTPSRALASSMGTTASAPPGRTAPVEIAIAWPPETLSEAGAPALDSSTRLSSTGCSGLASAVSADLTAKPSIAESSNAGTGSVAMTAPASTRPCASVRGTSSTSADAPRRGRCPWRPRAVSAAASLSSLRPHRSRRDLPDAPAVRGCRGLALCRIPPTPRRASHRRTRAITPAPNPMARLPDTRVIRPMPAAMVLSERRSKTRGQ